MCWLILIAPALAFTPLDIPGQETGEPGESEATAEPTPKTRRAALMEVNLRARYLAVPDVVLDIGSYNGDDVHETTGAIHTDRPKVRAAAAGVEFGIRKDNANGIFYFEYMPALVEDGYWDDRESDHDNFTDGDYVTMNGLALINLGANYAYEVRPVPFWSFYAGAGLGLAIKRGEIVHWDRVDANGNPVGESKVLDTPPVLPILDINAGMRFHFADRANLRIEAGLHNMLYVGAAAGVVF